MTSRITSVCCVVALVFGFSILLSGFSSLSHATERNVAAENTLRILERLELIEFTKKNSSAFAMRKAKRFYEEYLLSQGLDKKDLPETESYALFLPLDPRNKDRFVVHYVLTSSSGNDCAPLGCLITIFDNYGGNEWRIALPSVYAHNLWVGDNPDGGGPGDLFTQSYYISAKLNNKGGDIIRHHWENGRYENKGAFLKRQ